MGKEIAHMSDSRGNDVTVVKSDADPVVQVMTLGFAGNDLYSVKENGHTVATTESRTEAIDKAAERASK